MENIKTCSCCLKKQPEREIIDRWFLINASKSDAQYLVCDDCYHKSLAAS